MLIDKRCPNCGATMQFETTMDSMFCPFCGGMVTNVANATEYQFDFQDTPSLNEPNLYISYNTVDPSVGMVTRIVSTGVKNTYINGQTLSFHLAQGPQTVVLKIGSRNYNRDIVIPSDNSPVRIYASYNGRAQIAIDQPQDPGMYSNSFNGNFGNNNGSTSANTPAYNLNTPSSTQNSTSNQNTSAKSGKAAAGGGCGTVIFIIIMVLLLRSCLCGGDDSSRKTARNDTYTEAEYTTSKQQYTKPNIETSEQYMGDIKFLAPSSWYYKTSQGYKYYYVDENDTNVFLMAYYQETEPNNPSKSEFESSYMDGVVNGYTKEMQSVSIVSREVEQKGDFYIGIVNLKADFVEKYREMLVCIVFDCQTGIVYAFTFMEPENISEENRAIFYYVIDSIEKEF